MTVCYRESDSEDEIPVLRHDDEICKFFFVSFDCQKTDAQRISSGYLSGKLEKFGFHYVPSFAFICSWYALGGFPAFVPVNLKLIPNTSCIRHALFCQRSINCVWLYIACFRGAASVHILLVPGMQNRQFTCSDSEKGGLFAPQECGVSNNWGGKISCSDAKPACMEKTRWLLPTKRVPFGLLKLFWKHLVPLFILMRFIDPVASVKKWTSRILVFWPFYFSDSCRREYFLSSGSNERALTAEYKFFVQEAGGAQLHEKLSWCRNLFSFSFITTWFWARCNLHQINFFRLVVLLLSEVSSVASVQDPSMNGRYWTPQNSSQS